MPTDINERIADFHVRLGNLEAQIGSRSRSPDSPYEDSVELISVLVALICCYKGLGLPNHPYQVVFGVLIVSALYHKAAFPMPKRWCDWLMMPLNVGVLAILLKLVIGGGEARPLSWFLYPAVEGGLTSFTLTWQQTDASQWTLPLTIIQTFFLVLTLFGSLIGFELFCGLTSFILVVLSLPSLVSFEWSWALPGMIAALFSFYLQKE